MTKIVIRLEVPNNIDIPVTCVVEYLHTFAYTLDNSNPEQYPENLVNYSYNCGVPVTMEVTND